MTDTRQQILDGAFSALMNSGLPALSYDSVAEAAGVSRQLVRYYFGDPDALMMAICDDLAGLYRDRLVARAKDLEGPSRIEMFLDFYFGILDGEAKPQDDQVYDALMCRAAARPELRDQMRGQYTLLGQVLSHEFQLIFPNLTRRAADVLSFVFVSLMYGHWKMVASLGLSRDHNRLSREAMAKTIRAFVTDATAVTDDFPIWSADTS